MGYSMWFMAAACLSGVGADAPAPYAPAPAAGSPGVVYTQEDPGSGHGLGLRQRLSNLFHGRHSAPAPAPQQRVIMQSPEPRLADPPPAAAPAAAPAAPAAPSATITPANPGRLAPVPPTGLVPPAGGIVPTSASAGAGELNKTYVKRVAIADDASWIIGQLHYVHADGGVWVVRYAPLDTEDKYGGAVALAPGVDMSQLREGDLVFVKGHVLSEDRASKHVGAPLYHADSVDLNERPGEQ